MTRHWPGLTQLESLVPAITAVLAKKAENRPLTPEEYDQLTQFVDKIERRTAARKAEKKPAEEAAERELRSIFPEGIFLQNILDSGLPDHVAYILQEAGYATTGDLALTMKAHPDDILRLQGIGPRAMNEITKIVETLEQAQTAAAAEIKAKEAAEAIAEVPAPAAPETVEAAAELVAEGQSVEAEAQSPAAEAEQPAPEAATESAPTEGEEEPTFDKLFALKPDMIPVVETEEEEEVDENGKAKPGKKKKKTRKSVEITYDPDRDLMLTKKKHKRGAGDWDWEE